MCIQYDLFASFRLTALNVGIYVYIYSRGNIEGHLRGTT